LLYIFNKHKIDVLALWIDFPIGEHQLSVNIPIVRLSGYILDFYD